MFSRDYRSSGSRRARRVAPGPASRALPRPTSTDVPVALPTVRAKASLRRTMLRRRQALSREERDRLSTTIAERLGALPAVTGARHVVGYVATASEVDPSVLLAALAARGTRLFYPRASGDTLVFVATTPDTSWQPGPHGIVEPNGDETLDEHTDAVFLVPGVAFDGRGTRLGRGGGWYDRALAGRPHAICIGLASDACIVDALPRDPWDVPMHAIITESRTIVVGSPDVAGRREKSS